MKRFRLLRPDEIECRVQRCTEKGVSLLLYKTARTDADLLDETVGADKWENDFKLVDGVLYGGLGVDYGNGLVWKWDAGTESNTEAEKGRASDAFKRAGFKHGIGRELYSAPFVWVPAANCAKLKQDRGGRWTCNDRFDVASIEYDASEHIVALTITSNGNTVYSFGGRAKSGQATSGRSKPQEEPVICDGCNTPIRPAKKSDGSVWSVKDLREYSNRMYGQTLCAKCINSVQRAEVAG